MVSQPPQPWRGPGHGRRTPWKTNLHGHKLTAHESPKTHGCGFEETHNRGHRGPWPDPPT